MPFPCPFVLPNFPPLMTQISKRDSLRLRAFAIFIIVMHNFLHTISEWPGENEYSFSPRKAASFLSLLRSETENVITLFASYYGHYGVHLFVFLSGYGLARKYLQAENSLPPSQEKPAHPWRFFFSNWWIFQKRRWNSLFPAIFLAAIFYLIYVGSQLGFATILREQGLFLLGQMSGLANLIPGNAFRPIGPWWFVSLIFQLYLIFPLLLLLAKKTGIKGLSTLIVAALLLEYLFAGHFYHHYQINVNLTALGHLDTVTFGVLLAQRGSVAMPRWLVGLSIFVFIAGSLYGPLWILSGLSFVICGVSGGRWLIPKLENFSKIDHIFLRLGELSLPLFLVHGYLRKPLTQSAQAAQNWWTSLWTCALFILISLLAAWLLEALEKRTRQFVKKAQKKR